MIRQAPESDRFKAEMCESSITTKNKADEATKMLDEDNANDFGRESKGDDWNPEHLPWPEENESKD